MLEYKLLDLNEVSPALIRDYYDEFTDSGEECSVLWKLSYLDPFEFAEECKKDRGTLYLCFFLPSGRLGGIARITPNPNHIENGRMGYALRPTERGKGYAPIMLNLIQVYCEHYAINNVTACVDRRNLASRNALEKAGWIETGNVYAWTQKRLALEYVPKIFRDYSYKPTTADLSAE